MFVCMGMYAWWGNLASQGQRVVLMPRGCGQGLEEKCVSGQGPFLPVRAQQLDVLSLLENDMNSVHLYPTSSFTGQLYPTSDLCHTQPTFPVTDKGHIHVYALVNGNRNSFGFLTS